MYSSLLKKWRATEAEEAKLLRPADTLTRRLFRFRAVKYFGRSMRKKSMISSSSATSWLWNIHWVVFCCPYLHFGFSHVLCRAGRKKADWILPAGHGLDPDHEVLLRVRQRLNAAKRLKDYTWDQLLRWIRGNGNVQQKKRIDIFLTHYGIYIYILLYIIHMNWHLTELLKRRNLLRTPAFTDWLWFIDHFQPHSQQCLVWRCLASGEFSGFLFSATMISLALWTGRSLSTWCETPCLCHKKL